MGLPCREQRVKTGQGAGCLDWRGRWAELLFSSQKSMGDDLLEINRVFHLSVATLDHGSRLDAILNGRARPETQVPTSAAWRPRGCLCRGHAREALPDTPIRALWVLFS